MKTLNAYTNRVLALLFCLILFIECAREANSQTTESSVPDKKFIKIALLLDTSNSMDGLIDQAKSQLWNIVNELAKAKCNGTFPEVQIALYEYGNNNLPMSEDYIRNVTPLTNDLDQISDDLFKLTTNGGDEYCGSVIKTALSQLDWSSSSNDLQLIFISGNEPFTQGLVKYKNSCQTAKNKHVVVNTIFCGDFEEGIRTMWKNGADLTGGKYFSIEQDRKTVYIPSPYDDKISELNVALNKTYLAYGDLGQQKLMNQSRQDANSRSYGKVNSVKRAVSKSSHVYKNKSWDLVDASEDENFQVEELKEDELPEELKGKSTAEKKKIINEQSLKRKQIQQEINNLNQKRLAYVAEQRKEKSEENSLDLAIVTAVKDLAKEKNFIIE